MKVILLKDVRGLGKRNAVIEVSDGYASNYLIPRGLVVKYSESGVKMLDKQLKAEAEELLKKEAEAKEIANTLEGIVLEFEAPASKDGRMMGTISEKQVVEALKEKYNITIDKRKFVEKYPCNAFGYTNLKIELFKNVIGTIRVHVSAKK